MSTKTKENIIPLHPTVRVTLMLIPSDVVDSRYVDNVDRKHIELMVKASSKSSATNNIVSVTTTPLLIPLLTHKTFYCAILTHVKNK